MNITIKPIKNNMKKTVLQEVMTELEKLHPSLFDIHTEKGRQFVNHFSKYIELEKQQIIEAHGNKQKRGGTFGYVYYNLSGEQYYNETYNK